MGIVRGICPFFVCRSKNHIFLCLLTPVNGLLFEIWIICMPCLGKEIVETDYWRHEVLGISSNFDWSRFCSVVYVLRFTRRAHTFPVTFFCRFYAGVGCLIL